MIRLFLEHYNCPNCKYNAEDCSNYEDCTICPMAREDKCLCLGEATEEELATGNCKYFEQKLKI